MNRLTSSDLQSVETSSAGTLETLNGIVSWLHSQGFVAAEAALLHEVEARFLDQAVSPRRALGSPSASASASPQLANTVDLSPPPPLASFGARERLGGPERVVEAWRSKSGTPAASPRDPVGPGSGLAPPGPAPRAHSSRSSSRAPGSDGDEYDDDDDVGFWRIDAAGQEAALGLDLEARSSGDVGSARDGLCVPLSPSLSSASPPPGGVDTPRQSPLVMQPPVGLPPPRHNHSHSHSGSHSRSPMAAAALVAGGAWEGASSPGEAAQPLPAVLRSPQRVAELGHVPPAQPCSPASPGSSDAGPARSPFAAGSTALPAPPQRQDSAAQRQAGTAQWVFDQANSAGCEAYKSLLSFLDRSPKAYGVQDAAPSLSRQQHLALKQRQRQEQHATPRQHWHEGAELARSQEQHRQRHGAGASPAAAWSLDAEAPAPSPEVSATGLAGKAAPGPAPSAGLLAGQVASLSEGELRQAVADAAGNPRLGEADGRGSAPQAAAGEGGPAHAPPPPPPEPALSPVRVGTVHSVHSMQSADSTAPCTTGTQDAVRGGSPGDESLAEGGGGARPRMRHDPKPTNPFSFPTTSPSDQGEPAATAPIFGSWPSFKTAGSPSRSAEGYYKPGYCSTEDEGPAPKPSARRLHRAQLSASSLSNASAGLPPPPPPPGAASVKFPEMRRNSSQAGLPQYGSGTPVHSGGQYDDLALYQYDEEAVEARYDVFDLRIIHRRQATGYEPTQELPLRVNDLIAGRYQILDLLGQAAFSRAVQALDLKTGALVCLKVVKNSKEYVDQSLDEVKLLRYVNAADPDDEHGVLRLLDFFYFKEHLILVCELLRANLYEFSKHNRESRGAPYFTPPRIQSVARQVLRSLAFLHSLGLIHADLKPENILMRSFSACTVKVIDLGSSCFLTDRLAPYCQSRSYRAPEVIIGLPYGQKVDVWSLGCIVAELQSGRVLFQNASLPAILARVEGILGAVPAHMLQRGRYAHRYYSRDGRLYERNRDTGRLEFLRPKRSCLASRLPGADPGMIDFIQTLLQVDPARRPSAAEALQHPWLQQRY